MKIETSILNILAECRTEGNTVFLPEQLERKIYLNVNKCLTNIGGKWDRKAKGHVFDYEPSEALENLILTGESEDMKKTFQFFPTPRDVAKIVCDLAELSGDSFVLEPSIGRGDLADAALEYGVKRLYGVELNPEMRKYLAGKPYAYKTGVDFLSFAQDVFDGRINRVFNRIVMNPPFRCQQDIDHVQKAYEVLNAGGILVSVMSCSPFFRTNRKSETFRDWLDTLNAQVIELDEGMFKASGTNIRTNIVKIVKAA